MTHIYFDTDAHAPGAIGRLVDPATGEDILIQHDFDAPGVATTFGWDIRDVQVQGAHYYGTVCQHSGTDGTVACPDCGLRAITFIEDATDWLRANDGVRAEDPGYFDGGM